MLPAPFKSPIKPTIQQEWGNTSNNYYYFTHGINIPFHNGIDITFGDSKQTYGTECICPFDTAKVVKINFTQPMETKGNGVTIQGQVGDTLYQIVFWHTGEIKVKLGDVIKLGDVVCYVGNSGLCDPMPTKDKPHNGAHCHLMVFIYKKNPKLNNNWDLQEANNGVGGSQNPRLLFDFTKWTYGNDSGWIHDIFPIKQWVVNMQGGVLRDYLCKMLGL